MKKKLFYLLLIATLFLTQWSCENNTLPIPQAVEKYVLHENSVSKVNFDTGENSELLEINFAANAAVRNDNVIYILGYDQQRGSQIGTFNLEGAALQNQLINEKSVENRSFGLFQNKFLFYSSDHLYVVGFDLHTYQLTILVLDPENLTEINSLSIPNVFNDSYVDCVINDDHIFLSINDRLLILDKNNLAENKSINLPAFGSPIRKFIQKDDNIISLYYTSGKPLIMHINTQNLEISSTQVINSFRFIVDKNDVAERKGVLYRITAFPQPAPYAIGFEAFNYINNEVEFFTEFDEAEDFFGEGNFITSVQLLADKILLMGNHKIDGETLGVIRLRQFDMMLIRDIVLEEIPLSIFE